MPDDNHDAPAHTGVTYAWEPGEDLAFLAYSLTSMYF